MKNNIGIESIVLVLDANNALLAHFGCSAGAGVWFVTVSVVAAIIFFWLGQIIPQTFRNIMVPSTPPIKIDLPAGDAR